MRGVMVGAVVALLALGCKTPASRDKDCQRGVDGAIGLHDGLEEGNPILKGGSDRETLMRAFALKAAFYGFAKLTKAPPWVYRVTGYAQCGAAVWNTGQVLRR